jgi:hypothetical protein
LIRLFVLTNDMTGGDMKKFFILCLIPVFFLVFADNVSAAVNTPEEAFALVKRTVLADMRSDLPVYVSKAILPGGTIIDTFKGPVLTLDRASWFVFVDLHPGANWEHACRYILIDPETETIRVVDGTRPPEMIGEMKHFQGVDILGGENIRPVSPSKRVRARNPENLYAVILSGGASQYSNHVRYWNDCSSIFKTLFDVYGYLNENMYVAISDGLDPAPDQSNGGNSHPDLNGDGIDDITHSCTMANVNLIFSELATVLGPNDTLFIFTTDHGSGQYGVPGQPVTMNLWNNEEIWDYEFAALLEPIQCREMIITMEPCFSGGFVDDIINMNSDVPRVISTAANDHEYSWAMGPDYVYDEYVFYWTAAVTGEDAYGNPVDADYNQDGEITMDEAYQFALEHDTADENPQYGEWPTDYGATVTLAGSGPVSAGTVKLNREAYNCDDTILITVEDLDLIGAGTQDVDVTSSTETTPETVTLTEVGDGRFQGSITTGTGAPSADGVLQVTDGDVITVYYDDLDHGGAGPVTVTDHSNADCAPPVISDVVITDVSESSFTVTWLTNEPATSIVYYSETPGNWALEESTTLSTDHSITVGGLEDCTFYYIMIESVDSAENSAVDDNGGAWYGALTYELVTLYEANMDVDPGWTYENLWAWGVPSGTNGNPASGYTGDHVVGYNLSGTYTNNMPATNCTTQAFDCSSASQVYLSFWRWLGVESSTYDHASIWVSGDNGTNWTKVWDHSGTTTAPVDWTYVEYDISTIAAGQNQVRIRWTIGPTDGSVVYCGWNIDDVLVSYTIPCTQPTPTPHPTETPSCINNGDVNNDGVISASDAQLTFMIALGSYTPTYEEECAADCNGNGIVSAGDAQQVFMTALGSASCVDPL